MANSKSSKEIKNIKANVKDKFYSKTSLDGKYEAFIKKKYSLKSCHVPLQKADEVHWDNAKLCFQDSNESIAEPCSKNKVHSETSKIEISNTHKSNKTSKDLKKTVNITSVQDITSVHLDNAKLCSQDSNESRAEPCTKNKVNSETSKIKSSNTHKSNKTSKDFKKPVNITSVQDKNSVSSSSSVGTVSDCTSCYVALEKLAIPINHFSVYSAKKEEIIRNIAMCNSSTPTNSRNISPNLDVDNNYKKVHNCSFEIEMPVSESKFIPSVSESNVKQSIFNSTQDSNNSTLGTFISESKLSTPSSSESEENQNTNSFFHGSSSMSVVNKRIVKGNNAIFLSTPSKRRRLSSSGSDISKLDAGKGTEMLNDDQKSVPSKRRRLSSSGSDFSKLDAGKGTETLDDDQKSVPSKRRTLSSSGSDFSKLEAGKGTETLDDDQKSVPSKRRTLSSSGSDFSKLEADKGTETLVDNQKGVKTNESLSSVHCAREEAKKFDDLKCMKRTTKLLSLDSASSTVKNYQSSFKGRKGRKAKHKLRKCQIEKDFSYCDYNSSDDFSELDAGKGTETLDDNQKSVPSKRRILSSSGSDFCKLDAGKGTETLVDNQNGVKTNESLSSVHCAWKEAKNFDDLKCMKRTTKLLSVDSSSSTVKNYQSSFRGRKGRKAKHKPRKYQIEKDFSYCDYNSSDDSDSTVYNSSLATAQSLEQTLKNQKNEVPTSYILRAFNRNVEKNYSMRKEKNTCSKMCDKNKNVFTSKYKSSNSSETDENFSDNSVSNANKKVSEHKQLKHSFRGNHIRTERVHLSHTLKKNVNKSNSVEKSAASDISNNSESGQECKYNLKPCYVCLEDAGKNNIISNIENQFNDFHQKNPPKAICEIDCLEPKSSKQIHFSKKKKRSKSMKCIEKESFDDNKDYKIVKECIVRTDSNDLPEHQKDCIKKCSDYVDTNFMHESQDHGNESSHHKASKENKEVVYLFSDSSDSIPNLDVVCGNADLLKKTMECDNKNSSEEDSSENCIKFVNYEEVNSIISSKKCLSVDKDDELEAKVIHDDPDWDEAYFADTDEGSDNPESALNNDSCLSADICKPCSVNVLRNEIDSKNTTKRIPYSYLGSETKSVKKDDRFVFKSKTNGSVYIVDFFEYENIKKIFVTIHWKKGTLPYSNNESKKSSSPTLSERIGALGGFNRINANTSLKHYATSGRNQHENKLKYPGKENISVFDIGEILDRKKNSEPFDTDFSRPEPSLPSASLSDDTTLSITSSDHSDNKYDDFCVHCCAKFSSKKESYNHTCKGKLQKGYLCIYCEIVFSSYSKLQSHRELHSL